MSIGTSLQTDARQSMTMAPRLSQAQQLGLTLLLKNLPDLREYLNAEMAKNPCIEDIEQPLTGATVSDEERRTEALEAQSQTVDYPDEYSPEQGTASAITRDEDAAEKRQLLFDRQTKQETLEEHLLNQLEMSDIEPKDIPLAEILIGNLNDSGFFDGSIPDIMMVSGESEAKIRAVLKLITQLDPPGCGATNAEECLLAQLDKLDGSPYQQEVRELIERHHLADIAEGRRSVIEQDLGMSRERYVDVLKALRTLEPRPGRDYLHAGKSVPFVNPEVHAVKAGGRWTARVDDRSLPDIHISPKYLKMLENPNTDKETKTYIRERIAAIEGIEEAIMRRQETITNIAQAIFDAQPGFFEKGLKGLKPLTMQEIAEKVGVHHATVSRTVNDKYVSTPKGTVELRRFFTQGLVTDSGEQVAKDAVAEKIKALIGGEDKSKPLSDEKIAQMLKAEGLTLARRTVAKYRLCLGIPGTAERRS